MRRIAEIQIEMSEHRAALNAETELPAEKQTEIRNKLVGLEAEYQTEIKKAEEAREKRELDRQFAELRMGVELRNYIKAAADGAKIAGREAELNKELKIEADNMVPWEAFVERDTEDRADVVADVSGAPPAKPRMPIIERVFKRSDASFLNIAMPSVGPGEPNYPVMTAGASGSAKAANAAVEAEAVTFEGHSVEPSRAANARYLFNYETLAKFGSGIEDLLRRDARRVMGKVLDDQIVSGDGTGANIKGFLHSDYIDSTGVTDPTAKPKPTDFDEAYAERVDLLYSYDTSSVRLFIGKETNKYLITNRVDSGAAMDEGGKTYAEMMPGMYRASTRIAAPVGNIQKAYAFRTSGEMRPIAPVWQGVKLIRDEFTGAAKAQVAITLTMIFGFIMPRGKSKEVRFKLA